MNDRCMLRCSNNVCQINGWALIVWVCALIESEDAQCVSDFNGMCLGTQLPLDISSEPLQ